LAYDGEIQNNLSCADEKNCSQAGFPKFAAQDLPAPCQSPPINQQLLLKPISFLFWEQTI
jgi:hypothetical protein